MANDKNDKNKSKTPPMQNPVILPPNDYADTILNPTENLVSFLESNNMNSLKNKYDSADESEEIKEEVTNPTTKPGIFRKKRAGFYGYYYGQPEGGFPGDTNGTKPSPLSKLFSSADSVFDLGLQPSDIEAQLTGDNTPLEGSIASQKAKHQEQLKTSAPIAYMQNQLYDNASAPENTDNSEKNESVQKAIDELLSDTPQLTNALDNIMSVKEPKPHKATPSPVARYGYDTNTKVVFQADAESTKDTADKNDSSIIEFSDAEAKELFANDLPKSKQKSKKNNSAEPHNPPAENTINDNSGATVVTSSAEEVNDAVLASEDEPKEKSSGKNKVKKAEKSEAEIAASADKIINTTSASEDELKKKSSGKNKVKKAEKSEAKSTASADKIKNATSAPEDEPKKKSSGKNKVKKTEKDEAESTAPADQISNTTSAPEDEPKKKGSGKNKIKKAEKDEKDKIEDNPDPDTENQASETDKHQLSDVEESILKEAKISAVVSEYIEKKQEPVKDSSDNNAEDSKPKAVIVNSDIYNSADSYQSDHNNGDNTADHPTKKKSVLIKIGLTLAIIGLIASATFLLYNFIISPYLNQKFSNQTNADESISGTVSDNNLSIQKKYAALYKKYPDFAGKLYISNLGIDLSVAHTDNDKTYLKHNLDGTVTKYGNLFVECTNNIKSLDSNTVIYGHNMADGTMFGKLKQYNSLSVYKENPVIEFNTIYADYKWKVFSVFITNTNDSDDNGFTFIYNTTNFVSDNSYLKFINDVKERSIINTDVDVLPGDKILTLSTCSTVFKDARFVVMARLVRSNESEKVDVSKAKENPNPHYPQIWYDKNNKINPYK